MLCAGKEDTRGQFAPKLRRYDAFQMLKHLLAIYTEARQKAEAREPQPRRIVLLNCVWEMAHPEKLGRYEARYRELEAEEHAQYRAFREAVEPITDLFREMGIELSVPYLTFAEMLGSLELNDAHRQALNRYFV